MLTAQAVTLPDKINDLRKQLDRILEAAWMPVSLMRSFTAYLPQTQYTGATLKPWPLLARPPV